MWEGPPGLISCERYIFNKKTSTKYRKKEKTYCNLWCFSVIIVFHKKIPLIISGIFGSGGRQSWKFNTHQVQQKSSHMGSEFRTGKTCLFGGGNMDSFLLPQLGNIPCFWMMISGWNWIDDMWEWYPCCKMDDYISSLYESNAWMM